MQGLFINGIFIEECKRRFLCKININGEEELCYMSSSSKLKHFLQLEGREVLLTRNIGTKCKTRYTLHAVKYKNEFTLLNLSYVNQILLNEFEKTSRYSDIGSIYKEKKITQDLKVDFYIDGKEKIVVEAKGIITEHKIAELPAINGERAIRQLKEFKKLLEQGIEVHYYIVLLSPTIEELHLNRLNKIFFDEFNNCVSKGMKVFVYDIRLSEEKWSMKRRINIEHELLV